MRPKAVIFDLFGTLVDQMSLEDLDRRATAMAAALKVPNDKFTLEWSKIRPLRDTGTLPTTQACIYYVCQAMGLPANPLLVPLALEACVDYGRRRLTPRGDAVGTLSWLREQGYGIGLVSNATPEIPLLWPETLLAPLVEAPCFSCSLGMVKPDPRIFGLACQRLSLAPQECLYVADGQEGELQAAQALGMDVVQVVSVYGQAHTLGLGPKGGWTGTRINRLAELVSYVGQR